MVAVPTATADTRPLAEPTPATAVLLLAHVPPPVSESVVVDVLHTWSVPPIVAGRAFIVRIYVEEQPVGNV
jgi:hypothetical protein